MVANQTNKEDAALPDEYRSQLKPDARLEDTGPKLTHPQSGVRVWMAEGNRNRPKGGKGGRLLLRRQFRQRVLDAWAYGQQPVGRRVGRA
jgi:hypothetical protein